MSTQIRKAGIPRLRPLALGVALGIALMLWSVALAHADVAPTATTLTCTPDSAKAGQSVQCTAFVKGVVGKDAGQAVFKSEQGGTFTGAPCKLAFGELGIASCTVTYTAPDNGASSDRLHAIFSGNEANATSEDTFRVTILGGDKEEGGEEEGGEEEGGEEEGGEEIPPAPNPTATTLACTPDSAKAGQSVQCTAFVKGVVGKDAGQAVFKSEQGGTFTGAPCKLAFSELGIASCTVTYTAPDNGASSDRLHAIFSGNEANATSEDTFRVTILGGEEGGGEEIPPAPNPTATTLTCTPDSAKAGQSVHCTATVEGVVGSSAGTVLFKSEQGGTFSAGSCELAFARGRGSCELDYTPAATAAIADRLHAAYIGDAANAASEGLFTLAILGGDKEEGGKGVSGKVARVAPARRSRAHAHRHRHHSRHRAGTR